MNIKVKIGSTFYLPLQMLANGQPVNMTGYTIFCAAKKDINKPEKLFDLSLTNGISFVDVSIGKHLIRVDDTSSWLEGNYVMDIKYTDSQGRKIPTETKVLTVVKNVT